MKFIRMWYKWIRNLLTHEQDHYLPLTRQRKEMFIEMDRSIRKWQ